MPPADARRARCGPTWERYVHARAELEVARAEVNAAAPYQLSLYARLFIGDTVITEAELGAQAPRVER